MVPIDLSERVAFVTGAAGGIGWATTERLLNAGCAVVGNIRAYSDESRARFETLANAHPDRLIIVEGSVAESAVVDQAARTIFQAFKKLDILVNNAGIMHDAYIGMIADDAIDQVLSVNLGAVIKVTQTMARLMKRRKSGSIINIASMVGQRGNAAQMLYSASKAGVAGVTYSAAKELAPQGIRVNAVAPGFIETPMMAELPEDARQAILSQIGLGRAGAPEDIADVILFLASDLSRYMTGQVLGADGGWVL